MTQIDSPRSPADILLGALQSTAASAAVDWLREGIRQVRAASDKSNELAARSAVAVRRLGSEPLGMSEVTLHTGCGTQEAGTWRKGDAGRVCLLLAAVGDAEPDWDRLVADLFRHGDENERAVVVRALCLLPDPCSLSLIAQEAGRINSLFLYSALALDNPYSAACYDERGFNQVVLKCLFNGLPLTRIVGLHRRANPELSRMCEDYIDERTVAGREVPADIWLAVEPYASENGLALILRALEREEPAHRYHAALALSRRVCDPQIGEAFAKRLQEETEPNIRGLLHDAVARAPKGDER